MAISVLSPADVAKLMFAATGHMVTAVIFLHPELTGGTLLELRLFGQMHELPVLFFQPDHHLLVLLASQALMNLLLAVWAVTHAAGWTPEFL
jgi:hypothetical protein